MRLKRISLFAVLSLTIASGCSASRSLSHSSHDSDDRVLTPPRHDYEYSPSPSRTHEDFREPQPAPAPGEPVPAPPAFGVSRVKSVSWFKDMGSRLHRKPNPCAETCVDEELLGCYSPVDSCVSEQQPCETACEPVCETERPSRFLAAKRVKKSICSLFRKPAPAACSTECAIIEEQSCAAPVHCGDAPHVGQTDHGKSAPQWNGRPSNEPVRAPMNRSLLHAGPKRDCLVEPMLESEYGTDPGLITPSDVTHEIPQSPPLQKNSPAAEQLIPDSPAPPAPAPVAPGEPSLEIPLPGNGVPPQQVPAAPAPSTQIIDPPAWPRLNANRSVSPVSHSNTRSGRAEATPVTTGAPIVTPRPRQ